MTRQSLWPETHLVLQLPSPTVMVANRIPVSLPVPSLLFCGMTPVIQAPRDRVCIDLKVGFLMQALRRLQSYIRCRQAISSNWPPLPPSQILLRDGELDRTSRLISCLPHGQD